VSNSSIQFSCPPPSGGIIVDRKVYITLPIRLTLTGVAPVGQPLIQPNRDAPRAYPISSSIDTLQVSINNQSVSVNMSDIIQALLHYNTDEDLSNAEYSMTPNLLDQSQSYNDLFGTSRNPLSSYGDSNDKSMQARGAFPFRIVSNPLFVSGTVTAVVDMVVTEPIFLSPFYFGESNGAGFYNVNTMDFNFTFLGAAGNRMWSHNNAGGVSINSIQSSFNGFTPAFSYPSNQPLLLFNYITPNETSVIPYNMPITYPYFDIQRYPTDFQNSMAAGSIQTISSNNIQLNSIPRRMYVYVRERNQDLYNTSHNPDTYFSIENISIQFQNKNGLLASASKHQLYEMSVKNHCDLSWNQWSGGPVFPTGSFASQFGTVGSILCVEFATDIGLDSLEAPGKLGQYMLQLNVNAQNIANRSIQPTLYVVVVSEGTFTIEGLGRASTNIGVISSEDILMAQQKPGINYADIESVNGGNFLSGLANFGKNIVKGLEYATNKSFDGLDNLLKRTANNAENLAKIGKSVLPFVGLGEPNNCDAYSSLMGKQGGVMAGREGGVLLGGAQMDRASLRNRLKRI
jgi:hypothetical protein